MSEPSDGSDHRPNTVIGLAALTHGAYAGMDLDPIWKGLLARVRANPMDAGAMMDISTILQLQGSKSQGLEAQGHALNLTRVFERPGEPGGLRILAFTTSGDFMANTPIDFLLEGSDATLYELYCGEGEPLPEVPDHDVAIVAIGESDAARPVLAGLSRTVAQWPRPVVNARVDVIASLTRDQVAEMLAGSEHVVAPRTIRASRADIERLSGGEAPLDAALSTLAFPQIVRPVGSHAGEGLLRIDAPDDYRTYLAASRAMEFFVAPFVDYAGADGLYRKFRVAMIDGVPYMSHLAISSHWMVHYLSAGMSEDASKREEEAKAMETFDETFARRHAKAFEELQAAFGLDYYAIDCAETAQGKLLLFEADVAMIVHAMDDEETFPYKHPQMRKLFSAFNTMMSRRAGR